jgi:arabinofuranosyltransferase
MSMALSASATRGDREDDPPVERLSPLTVGMVAAAVVVTLLLAWHWRWTADDGFINFRVVRNMLAGDGPVFNAGQRVEVATSPLWLGLLAVGTFLARADVAWVAVVLGAVGSAAGVALACLGAVRLQTAGTARPARLFLPAGVMIFLAVPATWAFLTSGLETGLTFAWLGAVWFGTVRVATATTPTRPVWLLVVVGLGPLVRPDLTLVSGVLGLWLLVAVHSSWLRRVGDVAVAAVLPVAYEVFRMGYYGLLVPNTAVAKESSRQLWGRGWGYLTDLVDPYDLYVPAVLGGVLLALTAWRLRAEHRATGLVLVTVLAAALQALFVIRVGGDFMHGRLLLPAMFQVLCPIAMVPVAVPTLGRQAWERWTAAAAVTGLVAWGALCALFLRVDYQGGVGPRGISDERGFYVRDASSRNPVVLSDHGRGRVVAWGAQVGESADEGRNEVFAQNAFSGSRLVPLGKASDDSFLLVFQAGYLGYAVPDNALVIDFFGLTDPIGSHLEPGPPGRAGHEKVMPISWFWARFSDQFPERQSPDPALGEVTPAGLDAAREALACGDLAELIDATQEPMSWGRFGNNLTGARERTAVRVPLDPIEARERFC